ncbi:MAG: 4-oxalocrotonate tautomerase [Actinobacteria bacterium]|nr:4-oxalocrotonate tautomerase [Actinomycetota bacterium]
MPTIEVKWFAGRTNDQKARLAKAITDAVVDIGETTPGATHIIYHDIKKSDWAQSGRLVSES